MGPVMINYYTSRGTLLTLVGSGRDYEDGSGLQECDC